MSKEAIIEFLLFLKSRFKESTILEYLLFSISGDLDNEE